MSELNVVWLSRYGPEGASSRYRVHQIVEGLRRRDVAGVVYPLATWREPVWRQILGNVRRIATIARIDATAGAVVVQKEPANPPAAWPVMRPLVRRVDPPVVWDVDDAVWIGRSGSSRMARDMASRATVVVAGNELIADWARMAGARRVVVIPTCYSPRREPPTDHPDDAVTRYVWIGSPATAELLVPMERVLSRVLSDASAELTMIGGAPPPRLSGHPRVRSLDWSVETEHTELGRADYGLAVQPRTEYADHKCGFKIVQYMAYGVVPIATDNPVHRTILGGHGILLESSPSGDGDSSVPNGRPSADQSRAVRDHWRDHYSLEVAVDAWSDLLRQVTA